MPFNSFMVKNEKYTIRSKVVLDKIRQNWLLWIHKIIFKMENRLLLLAETSYRSWKITRRKFYHLSYSKKVPNSMKCAPAWKATTENVFSMNKNCRRAKYLKKLFKTKRTLQFWSNLAILHAWGIDYPCSINAPIQLTKTINSI